MPTDLDINQDKDVRLDGANDLALTSGQDQVEQSVGLDVLDVTRKFVGSEITGSSIGLLEERVKESLNSDEQVGEVLSVDVTEYDREANSVILDVTVLEAEDFSLELTT